MLFVAGFLFRCWRDGGSLTGDAVFPDGADPFLPLFAICIERISLTAKQKTIPASVYFLYGDKIYTAKVGKSVGARAQRKTAS